MKILAIFSLLVLTGCAYHPIPQNVYGKSGTAYTAPTICAALTKCMLSESSCYYDTSSYTDATSGKIINSNSCVEIKK